MRQDDGAWRYKLLVGLEATLEIESLDLRLPFASIYRNVEFGPETDAAPEVPRPR
jgi:hypothetical protein